MGRPIGARLIEAVSIVESIGPCRAGEVRKRMLDINRDNASKYLDRAQRKGWVTVSGELYHRVYAAVPGWQDRIDGCASGVRALPMVRAVKQHHLQAVWR